MKRICVFFSEPNIYDYPFDDPLYLDSYKELASVLEAHGAELSIVRGVDSYLEKGKFKNSWKFINGDLVETGLVVADVIFDRGTRGNLVTDGSVPLLNIPEVNEICTDKWKSYQAFKQFSPLTKLALSDAELSAAFDEITTKKIVVKPLEGEGGRGVFIGTREVFKIETPQPEYPLLVQEWLDSSIGIPGVVDGMHDFRITMMDGNFIFAFVRTPPPGGLKANFSEGGELTVIEKENIPKEFWDVLSSVESYMSKFPSRMYSIDMALTPSGPRIIELNSRVGLLESTRHSVFSDFKQKLARKLISLAQ